MAARNDRKPTKKASPRGASTAPKSRTAKPTKPAARPAKAAAKLPKATKPAKATKASKPTKPAKAAPKAPTPAPKAAAAAPAKRAPVPAKPTKPEPAAKRPAKPAEVVAPAAPTGKATPAKRGSEAKAAVVKAPPPPAKKGDKGVREKRPMKPLRPMRQPPLIKNYQFIGVPQFKKPLSAPPPPPPPPRPAPPPEPPPASLEERVERVHKRLAAESDEFRRVYEERYVMSWIVHDSALEGTVYSIQELDAAIHGTMPVGEESSLQPAIEEIRRHREAIEFSKDFAINKRRQPITVDLVRKLYLILHPEEGDLKTVKYRKDIPQHRLYFHEYAAPDKIAYKVRQVVDWINDPETKKGRNALRIAARAHYDLLRVFPFALDSGKVARLLMNILLLRAGLEPAIVHSTERQRYYEALKGSVNTIIHMVQEAEENGLASIEKLLDDHAAKARGATV